MPSSCDSHSARGEIRNDLSTNIATLTSTTSLAAEAFRLPRNLLFIVIDSIGTRENTPVAAPEDQTIPLTTEHFPYAPEKGFVFGSQDEDNVAARNSRTGVSRIHFSLFWNWERGSGFVLRNHSRFGTTLKGLRCDKELGQDEEWPLSSGDMIHAGLVAMRITYPEQRHSYQKLFEANWKKGRRRV